MLLRTRGYYVEANTAYPDPDTGKSRELDLHAIGVHRSGPDDFDFLLGTLLIECVNNPQPIAFFTKDPQTASLHRYEVKLSGIPVKMPVEGQRGSWQSLQDYLGMQTYHHYCRGRIATQFCSFTRKGSGWFAEHQQGHFDSFLKLRAAIEHFVDQGFKGFVPGPHESVHVDLYYPLVVVQGRLLEVRPTKRSARLVEVDHVQYRHAAFMGRGAADYQLDIVTEQFLPKYLDMVEGELAKTARLLRRRHNAVRQSIDRIAGRCQRLRSPEKIRAALEF